MRRMERSYLSEAFRFLLPGFDRGEGFFEGLGASSAGPGPDRDAEVVERVRYPGQVRQILGSEVATDLERLS